MEGYDRPIWICDQRRGRKHNTTKANYAQGLRILFHPVQNFYYITDTCPTSISGMFFFLFDLGFLDV